MDSTTGQEKWSIPGKDILGYGSAVVAGGIVYVGGQNFFNALDGKTGKQIWSAKISERAAGPASIVNGVVYFGTRNPMPEADTYIYALDGASGAEKWKTKIPEGASDSLAVEDNTIYCEGATGTLYALDAGTGQQKWAYTFDKGALSSPAVSGGLVYVTGYDALYAIDMRNGHLIWTLKTGAALQTEPAIAGNYIYFSGDSGELTFSGLQSKELLYAVDAKSGQPAAAVKPLAREAYVGEAGLRLLPGYLPIRLVVLALGHYRRVGGVHQQRRAAKLVPHQPALPVSRLVRAPQPHRLAAEAIIDYVRRVRADGKYLLMAS